MIKVNELFSGIGAFRKALDRLNLPYEIVGISEIDKYAIKSYEAIFGKTRNYGDISKVQKLDYADLWTYGFPCQDISVAGNQAGIVKGQTRSGLLYEVQRLLVASALDDELPKYLILENVKNLVGKKFINQFIDWGEWLKALGYTTYYTVLNAKDFGIPQNRERVFAVSIHNSVDIDFKFPEPIPLTTDMFDYLEDEVDEKYYLTDTYIEYAENLTQEQIKVGGGFKFAPVECNQVATLVGNRWDKCFEKSRRIYGKGLCPTLDTCGGGHREIKVMVMEKQETKPRIRKLTPLECWRLMGFDDEDFRKAESVCSNTQLYKQAGNSIVVNVLEGILSNLFPNGGENV